MHTCDSKHAKRHPDGVWSAVAVIPAASLASRLSIAHRRRVQIASGARVRSSSHGRGPACSACCCAARDAASRARRALRGAVGACWLASGGPSIGVQSASERAHGSRLAALASVGRRTGAGAGLDLDDRERAVSEEGGDGALRGAPPWASGSREPARRRRRRRAPRTWLMPASCQVALQRGGVPRGGPGLVTSFHRPHTCSLRRFELSRSEARAAKAHVQMRAWQEASRGTPWDSSPPTAGGRPETVGERVGEAGFGGCLPGSAATRDDAPGGGCLWGWCGPWPTGRWWGGFSPRWVTIRGPVAEACQRGDVRRGRRLEERQHVQLPKETRTAQPPQRAGAG